LINSHSWHIEMYIINSVCLLLANLQIKKALRGVKVQVNHGQNIRRYKVTGLTKEPLRDLK